LISLERLYIKIETLRRQLEYAKEAHAKEIWTWQQYWPHTSHEVRKQIHVERKVNELDPDFSFQDAVDAWQVPESQ
jgi:hypothetical protein